ncbi:MAG: capsular polysaccharide synthesis protein [Treponema sp.]|nr:capsular polysaccharide synthesis protein [Treponema sp.]
MVLAYLRKKFKKTLNQFKTPSPPLSFDPAYPIWFLWFQGEEAMPLIVKACYQTLLQHSNGHPVNLVTRENYVTYVTLPDFLLDKVNKGKISLTHFSDIMRLALLHEHGGLWVDSTVLLTKPLQPLPEISSYLGFWTPKDDGKIIATCFGASNWIIRDGRWVTFCFYSSKNNIMIYNVLSLYLAYVKKYNVLIDYFLFDYLFALAYETLPQARIMIDSVPPNNPQVHEIYHRLGLDHPYNEALFNAICETTAFHKLNWKEEFPEYTPQGELTNYGHIIRNYPGL